MKLDKRSVFGWGRTTAAVAPCRDGLVVHYDGNNQHLDEKNHGACRDYWKRTRKFHVNGNGWRDIGYSFGVCPHGYVLEGRGWGREQAAQPGGNRTWTSVTFMSGPSEKPTQDQLKAFGELRSHLKGKGLRDGLKGHGDFYATSCPGDILYSMIRDGSLTKGYSVPNWQEEMMRKLPLVGPGSKGEFVETVQGLLLARSHPEVRINGKFDAVTEKAVKAVQKWGKVDVDGWVGPQTWPVLLRVHK